MSKYQFGSIVDRDFRNTLQRLADDATAQGKAIQDLVAEGQLTEEQYAELIRVVSGNIRRGEATFDDIDINQGKLLPRHMSEEVLRMIAGEAPINAVPADSSLTTEKYADKSVTLDKVNFVKSTKNLVAADYLEWGIVEYQGKMVLQRARGGFHTKGKLAKVSPNTQYTATVHGDGNRFALAGLSEYPTFSLATNYNDIDQLIVNDPDLSQYTFTTGDNIQYVYFYVSNTNQEPDIQIEFGENSTKYIPPLLIDETIIKGHIIENVQEYDNTVSVIEDIENGYPARPNATSVIWIGPNEPKEIEPYDEWRESKGHTLFQDFTKFGETLNDWRLVWNKYAVFEIVDNSLKLYDINGSDTVGNAATNKKIDQNLVDGEVYLLAYSRIPRSAQNVSVLLRGEDGTGESYAGYSIGFYNDNIRIRKYSKDAPAITLAETRHDNLKMEDKKLNIVARVDGNTIKAKAWNQGETEPDWMLEAEDSDFTSGIFGINKFPSSDKDTFLKFGIGTNGMKAPRRQLIR